MTVALKCFQNDTAPTATNKGKLVATKGLGQDYVSASIEITQLGARTYYLGVSLSLLALFLTHRSGGSELVMVNIGILIYHRLRQLGLHRLCERPHIRLSELE